MNRTLLIGVAVAVAAIGGVAASLSAGPGTADGRMHGTVSTEMGSPILGDPAAPITIVEFGDYQCHQCYNWFHNTKPEIQSRYIDTGMANLVFVDLAFLGRDSPTAAQASYCAEDQGMYWEYHDTLYEHQEDRIDGGWADSDRLKAFAFSLGLDTEEFDGCLDSGKHSKRVNYNSQQAREHGISGTPGFIITGPGGQESISGAQPFGVFKRVLDSMV